MLITVENLEAALPDFFMQYSQTHLYGPVLTGIFPALYLAARAGGVEVIDVLIASRHCSISTMIILDKIVRDEHASDVLRALAFLREKDALSDKESRSQAHLRKWIRKRNLAEWIFAVEALQRNRPEFRCRSRPVSLAWLFDVDGFRRRFS